MLKDSLVRVSPPVGTRGVRVTRSTFREPITDMTAGLEDISIVGFRVVRIRWCCIRSRDEALVRLPKTLN
jgi:hypothetical protein